MTRTGTVEAALMRMNQGRRLSPEKRSTWQMVMP